MSLAVFIDSLAFQCRPVLLLTWHGDKKLDSIPMSMEAQLGVGHGAVGNKAA